MGIVSSVKCQVSSVKSQESRTYNLHLRVIGLSSCSSSRMTVDTDLFSKEQKFVIKPPPRSLKWSSQNTKQDWSSAERELS